MSDARSATTAPIPPSVLVSELLDYTGVMVVRASAAALQSKNISPAPTCSSAIRRKTASQAEAAAEERTLPAPFIAAKISPPEAEWRQLDNAKLLSFFGNPSKFLIRERLGLRIPRLDSLLEETEPLEPHGLAKYLLEQDFLNRALGGEEFEPLFPVARARGTLPPGRAGESHLRELSANARLFAEVGRQKARNRAEPEQLQLTIGRFELSARIDSLFDGRLVRQSPDDSETERPARRLDRSSA